MIPAIVISLIAGIIGWRRAARAGGVTADKLQYAAAHAIPAFLVVMIAMVFMAEMRWLGW
ncbi:MAG: hypothetical protein AAGK00_06620 [Pseudomonadota bacterium]